MESSEPGSQFNTQLGEDSKVFVGGSNDATTGFSGWIADFAIFSRALSAGQVNKIYNLEEGLSYKGTMYPSLFPSAIPSE